MLPTPMFQYIIAKIGNPIMLHQFFSVVIETFQYQMLVSHVGMQLCIFNQKIIKVGSNEQISKKIVRFSRTEFNDRFHTS